MRPHLTSRPQSLKKLVLDSCGLTDISYNCELPSEGEHEGHEGRGGQLVKFATLESLSLSRNKLTEVTTHGAITSSLSNSNNGLN